MLFRSDGIGPKGTRYTDSHWPKAVTDVTISHYKINGDQELFAKRLKGLHEVAQEFKVKDAQFYLAWCLVNQDVSTAIMGASKPEQLVENLGAVDLMKQWTPEMEKRINEVMQNIPNPSFNWRDWKPFPDRRPTRIEFAK